MFCEDLSLHHAMVFDLLIIRITWSLQKAGIEVKSAFHGTYIDTDSMQMRRLNRCPIPSEWRGRACAN